MADSLFTANLEKESDKLVAVTGIMAQRACRIGHAGVFRLIVPGGRRDDNDFRPIKQRDQIALPSVEVAGFSVTTMEEVTAGAQPDPMGSLQGAIASSNAPSPAD